MYNKLRQKSLVSQSLQPICLYERLDLRVYEALNLQIL